MENVIFDLGGVLLNIDLTVAVRELSRLAGRDLADSAMERLKNPLFDAFETGHLSETDFREGVRSLFAIRATDVEIDDAWNAMLLDLPPQRLQAIHALKLRRPQTKIFLLSNTNSIHVRELWRKLSGWGLAGLFETAFDKLYFSHEMGLRKPGRTIFEQVINEQGLSRELTLFVDDSPLNVEGAQSVGLRAELFARSGCIEGLLKHFFSQSESNSGTSASK